MGTGSGDTTNYCFLLESSSPVPLRADALGIEAEDLRPKFASGFYSFVGQVVRFAGWGQGSVSFKASPVPIFYRQESRQYSDACVRFLL